MPITWPEALLLAVLVAALGLAGNVIAGLINHNLSGVRGRTVALLAIALVLATAGVTAYQTMRQQPSTSDPSKTPGALNAISATLSSSGGSPQSSVRT
jgi:hypothetical protein